MMLESDTVSRDQVGAVFGYVWKKRLRYPQFCIVDTGGKSPHAWFDAPRSKVLERRLKPGLEIFGCGPKVFTYSRSLCVRRGRGERGACNV